MEQTPSLPGHSPELPSVSPSLNRETGGAFSNPEIATGSGVERQEQRGGASSGAIQSAPPLMPVFTPTPVATPVSDTTVPTLVSPAVASDDDLIEKEWVEKAKKVIAETKDDPYRREEEVSRLQVDYLEKRYGRQLGPSQ